MWYCILVRSPETDVWCLSLIAVHLIAVHLIALRPGLSVNLRLND